MSYLSASENVGYSGIPQTISDATCASQYKMAVEGVPAVCSEMNSFINENSGDENSYSNDNYFHTKFKIDPNELYTFHDSDIIAGEITVSHTEDNFIFNDNIDAKPKMCFASPRSDTDIIGSAAKVCIKEEIKPNVVQNGHLKTANKTTSQKDVKTSNTKVQKVVKSLSQLIKDPMRTKLSNVVKSSINMKGQANIANMAANLPTSTKTSINSVSSNPPPVIPNVKTAGSETFLDVFKREQGLVEDAAPVIKMEPDLPPPAKVPGPPLIKKVPSGKPASASKRRGRGPTVHEALQRIPRRAVPVANRPWHAPGQDLFDCGPLGDTTQRPFTLVDSSSSEDDDQWPNFGERMGCVEETQAESRGARLALRRAALRRQVAQASAAMSLRDHRPRCARPTAIKKQLSSAGARLPASTVNQLLALRGMPSLLTSQERRLLRQSGWSGGESFTSSTCTLEGCVSTALPHCSHCLQHARSSPGQKLYAACSAVFAGGERCSAAVLPLQAHTPLCAQHARKRDNYDKLSREVKPKRALVRRRWPPPPRRRRRPPLKKITATANQSLSELNVCSNSSAYDSSEEAGIGALSDSEFIASAAVHELEVEQVPPDDILDSAVLGQIPDEAFTEFFNQAEGGATFAESSELARALEAVLDERALDSLADSLQPSTKMQVSTVGVEMSSGVSS